MADSSSFFSAETYRVGDPIENLQLRVTLRKRGGTVTLAEESSAAKGSSSKKNSPRRRSIFGRSSSRSATGGDSDDDGNASDDDAETGEASSRKPLQLGKDEEDKLVCPPRVFRWQEKVFGPMEVSAIRREEERDSPRLARRSTMGNMLSRAQSRAQSTAALLGMGGDEGPSSLLSNHHREVFARLQEEAEARGETYEGELLYSRVHSEEYTDPADVSLILTDSMGETMTPLARAVVGGAFARQHRDMLGEAASVSMHIFAALPSRELHDDDADVGSSFLSRRASAAGGVGRRRSSFFGGQRDAAEGNDQLEEVLLCALRVFPGGRLDVKPPFSVEPGSADPQPDAMGDKMARWYSVPGTRYEYMLENLSESLGGAEAQYEAIAERVAKVSLHAHAAAVARAIPELDFARPPIKSARVHHFVELTSCHGFGPNPLYVVYYALAAPGWRLLPHCVASAVTQTSKVVGRDAKAVLGFPMEFSLESDGPPTAARAPLSLFLSVMSHDAHDRITHLGYAHIAPPAVAGYTEDDLRAWRIAEGRLDALSRFFVGGTEELRDLRALAIPEGFDISKRQCLNKHGLQTVTTGSIHIKIHTVLQQQQPPAAPKAAQKLAGGGKAGGAGAGSVAERLRRAAPEMGSMKGVLGVSTLARSETAADRVRRRLEERQRAAAQRLEDE